MLYTKPSLEAFLYAHGRAFVLLVLIVVGNLFSPLQAQDLNFDTGSYLGGAGRDAVRGAEIQSDGTIVLAANISDARPGDLEPILLGDSTPTTPGAILRLSPDGKQVLSVTRLANEVADLSLDGADNIYVAARVAGLIKLTPEADVISWTRPSGGTCDRVDAARNGDVVGLKDAFEFAATQGDPRAYIYDADGNELGNVAGQYNRTYDVAIDGDRRSVFLVGFNQTLLTSRLPVQIAYIKCTAYDGTLKWKAYDWTGAQVSNGNEADTRAARVSMGRDGYLYVSFVCAGGNHIFRYDPFDLGRSVPIVGGDAYHQFNNTRAEHKTFFGRYDPVTGAYLLGQQLTARLPNGRGNTCNPDRGDIKADEQGRVYLTGVTAFTLPFSFDPVPAKEYGGGPFFVIMSPDFRTRRILGRTCSSGLPHAVAVRTLDGQTSPNVVYGGQVNSPTLWTQDPIQADRGGEYNGFFAVKVGMSLPVAESVSRK